MGNALQKIRLNHHGKAVGIVMIGLDAAGKTTTLYRLHLGEVMTTIPTIGFNVENVTYKNINFTALDVGGRCPIRPLIRHYYKNTSVVVFVLDSNDRERLPECKDEIWRMLGEDELKTALLLVMANKQDLPNAMSVEEITEKLELNKLRDRDWHIQGTCATTGEGLYEGLNWVHFKLSQKEVKKTVVKPVKEIINSVQPEVNKLSGKPDTSSWWSMITNYFTKTTPVSA